MKKIFGLLIAAVAVLSLNGCGGGGQYNDGATTLFLVDFDYNAVNGVEYNCNYTSGTTFGDGEFTFYPPDDCSFRLDGIVRDLFIVDVTNTGKNGIPYDCVPSGINGFTGDYIDDGGFNYATDDVCTFSF